MSIDKLKTKFFNGAFINNVKHYFDKINEIIDWINNVAYVPSYESYVAMISQESTNAPYEVDLNGTSALPIQDELGGIWSYDSSGVYIYTKTGLCANLNKLYVNLPSNVNAPFKILRWGYNTQDSIYISTSVFTDNIAHTDTDGILYVTPIEIRLYN